MKRFGNWKLEFKWRHPLQNTLVAVMDITHGLLLLHIATTTVEVRNEWNGGFYAKVIEPVGSNQFVTLTTHQS